MISKCAVTATEMKTLTVAKLLPMLVLLLPLVASVPLQGHAGSDIMVDTSPKTTTIGLDRNSGIGASFAANPTPAVDDALRAQMVTPTTQSSDSTMVQDDSAAAEDVVVSEADDDMRGRMAYLILSLWDSELHGLDDHLYLRVDDEPSQAQHVRDVARQKRDVVFTPLWVTNMKHAERRRLRERYYRNNVRSQRIGRSLDTLLTAASAASTATNVEGRRSAAAADAVDGQVLSRERRQLVFRPLFVARQRQAAAAARDRRVRREGPREDDRVEQLSRRRRGLVEVPLFADRQTQAERVEDEITSPRRSHQLHKQWYYFKDFRVPSADFRPYRSFYRFSEYE